MTYVDRFHDVTEFDEAKRSCRRRLEGHNLRRRKGTIPNGNLFNYFSLNIITNIFSTT